MPADEMNIDPEIVREGATKIVDAGDGHGTLIRQHCKIIRDIEETRPWGGDEPGVAFDATYTEGAEVVNDTAYIIPEVIMSFGARVTLAANSSDGTDGTVSEAIDYEILSVPPHRDSSQPGTGWV